MGSSLSLTTVIILIANFVALLPNVFSNFFKILCVWSICLQVCLWATCMPSAQRALKRAPDPMEWELHSSISCYVGAENEHGPLEEQPLLSLPKISFLKGNYFHLFFGILYIHTICFDDNQPHDQFLHTSPTPQLNFMYSFFLLHLHFVITDWVWLVLVYSIHWIIVRDHTALENWLSCGSHHLSIVSQLGWGVHENFFVHTEMLTCCCASKMLS